MPAKFHGADLTITRAHIDEAQAGRLIHGEEPLTPEQLVLDFVRFPQPRHFERAKRLMAERPQASGKEHKGGKTGGRSAR